MRYSSELPYSLSLSTWKSGALSILVTTRTISNYPPNSIMFVNLTYFIFKRVSSPVYKMGQTKIVRQKNNKEVYSLHLNTLDMGLAK